VLDDFEQCYLAVKSRDPRFDGWFYTAVTSTRIYCRPSCPVQTPMSKNVRFYPSAAAAQLAGFRACKRCRPDASPGSPEWNSRADVAARAMRLIADGVVDREGVPGLATRLGYGVRQLERTLQNEIGAGPIAIARAQRAQTARILIETTLLPMTEVAFAAGFSSVRQFNDTVQSVYASSPTALRSRHRSRRAVPEASTAIDLRLAFRQPLCPDNLFGHLAATAVPGVEEVRDATYRRTLRLAHGPGVVELTPTPDYINCRAVLADMRDLTATIARSRWLLDLDADPVAIDRQLSLDAGLAPLVAKSPGRRVPRCVDGDEMAVRAILGQHISTAAARTHAGRMASQYGEPLQDPGGGLTRLFPSTDQLRDVELAVPLKRRETFDRLVDALRSGILVLGPGSDRVEAVKVLASLAGVGPWTRGVIAMRALGDPDVLLETDLGVRRAAEHLGLPATPAALIAHASPWRPWRSYAVQYLWSVDDHSINHWPPHANQSPPKRKTLS
jgi:AraC family transcriptional regulator of adaptative response / DNA-3-methyladenine glycosylase II